MNNTSPIAGKSLYDFEFSVTLIFNMLNLSYEGRKLCNVSIIPQHQPDTCWNLSSYLYSIVQFMVYAFLQPFLSFPPSNFCEWYLSVECKFCLLSIGFFGIFEKKMPILEFGYQNFTSILLYIKITSVNVSFKAK